MNGNQLRESLVSLDFGLDVWADLDEESAALRRELRAIDPSAESARAAVLLFQLGRIGLARGEETDSAQYLLRSYTMRPQFRPTLRLTRSLYFQRQDFRLVNKLIAAEARATRDPLTRSMVLRDQAFIQWFKLADVSAARESLEAALRLDETSLATLLALRLLCIVQQDEPRRQQVLERLIELVADRPLQGALYVELAASQLAQDTSRALRTLETARRACPQDTAVMATVEAIHANAGDHAALAALNELRGNEIHSTPEWAARQLARAAYLQRDVLDHKDEAARLLRRSVALDPQLSTTADCLDLLLDLGQFELALGAGQTLHGLVSDPLERATVAWRNGEIAHRLLDDRALAQRWYASCLGDEPSYEPALEGLSALVANEDDHAALLAVHRADLGAARDPAGRTHRLFRIATLLERQGQLPEAIDAYREAIEVRPNFLPALAALEKVYSTKERWTELVELYAHQLDHEAVPARTLVLLESMAQVWEHHLNNPEAAIRCYQRILVVDPNHLHTLRTCARLCNATRRWHDVVSLTEQEVGLSVDPQRKSELLHRMGEIWEERLLDLDRAFDCYQRSLDHNPMYLPGLRALGRLCRQKGRWNDLIEMQRTEAAATSDSAQSLALLIATAEVYEEELLAVGDAADTYRAILERHPNHLSSIESLGRALEQLGQWSELAARIEQTLDAYPTPTVKALQLFRLAQIRATRLDDAKGAIAELQRARRLSASLVPVLWQLLRHCEELGDIEWIERTLMEEVAEIQNADERSAHFLRLAALVEEHGQNPRQAALLYEQACEGALPPISALLNLERIYRDLLMHREQAAVVGRLRTLTNDPRLGAELDLQRAHLAKYDEPAETLKRLARAQESGVSVAFARRERESLLETHHDPQSMEEMLLQRVGALRSPTEIACALSELGYLRMEQGDEAGAEEAFKEALLQNRAHLSALTGLGLVLERHGRWEERAELAEAEAATLESTQELADALHLAGQLWQDRLGTLDRALPLFEQAMKVRPGHPLAYQRLHGLHTKAEDWSQLAALVRNQIAACGSGVDTAPMFYELGVLYRSHLDQPRKAEACFRRAVELLPNDIAALGALGDVYVERQKWERAEEAFSRVDALETAPLARRSNLRRLARTQIALHTPKVALASLERAYAAAGDPPVELIEELADAAQRSGNPAAQASALEQLADRCTDARNEIQLRRSVAVLADEQLGDDDWAIRALQGILALDPLDLPAIEKLAAVFARNEQRAAAKQHLQAAVSHHRAALARTPFAEPLYRQLADIFRWQRAFDELFCVYNALSSLEPLETAASAFVEQHSARAARLMQSSPLSETSYETCVLPEAAMGPLRTFFRQQHMNLGALIAQKPNAYGLRRGNRVRAGDPLWDQLSALCEWAKSDSGFDLWVSSDQPDDVSVAMFAEPALIVGSKVRDNAACWTAAERFQLGHALCLLQEGALPLRDRSIRDIRVLLAAAARLAKLPVDPFGIEPGDPLLAPQLTQLQKVLGRRQRKGLVEGMHLLDNPASGSGDGTSLGSWVCAIGHAAMRLGLVLSASPQLALAQAAEGSEAADREGLADLLQYTVSEQHFAARRVIGVCPTVKEAS